MKYVNTLGQIWLIFFGGGGAIIFLVIKTHREYNNCIVKYRVIWEGGLQSVLGGLTKCLGGLGNHPVPQVSSNCAYGYVYRIFRVKIIHQFYYFKFKI